MKITKLVALFNKDKIILGLVVSITAVLSSLYTSVPFNGFLLVLGLLILVNIAMSLYAAYSLYDQSDLYKPEKLFSKISFTENDKVVFLHASFDPISRKLEKLVNPKNLKIYNLYGNRHEDEKSIEISNRVFPPHPNQINVDPTHMPDESQSVDYILAITSAHEILTQEKRVKFFQESRRLLKDDGTLILCEQMRDLTNFIFFNIGAFHFVTWKDWESAIKKSGLIISRKTKLTRWGTVLYINKRTL